MSAPADPRKRVFVLAPFDKEPDKTELKRGVTPEMREMTDAHKTASDWVKAKNGAASTSAERSKKAEKIYFNIGLEELTRVNFNRGDRLYIHGHGGENDENISRFPDGPKGKDLTIPKLKLEMMKYNTDIFKSKQIDIRMMSCHSHSDGTDEKKRTPHHSVAREFAKLLSQEPGADGYIKGYRGDVNVSEMTGKSRGDPRKLAGIIANPKGGLADFKNPGKIVNYGLFSEKTKHKAASGDREDFSTKNPNINERFLILPSIQQPATGHPDSLPSVAAASRPAHSSQPSTLTQSSTPSSQSQPPNTPVVAASDGMNTRSKTISNH